MAKSRRSKKTIEEREQEILERMRREEEERLRAEKSYLELEEVKPGEREEAGAGDAESRGGSGASARSRKKRAEAKKNQKMKLRMPSLAAILFIAFVLIAGAATIKTIMSLQLEHSRLEKENEELTKKRDKLKIELKHVNSREYIEEQARRQLRLVNPDEILFIFHSEGSGNANNMQIIESESAEDETAEAESAENESREEEAAEDGEG